MVRGGNDPGAIEVLRPRRQLVARSIVAALALLVPLFIVLLWLSLPSNTWPWVVEITGGFATLGLIGAISGNKMRVYVNAGGLEIRRLLGRVTTIDAADIAGAVLVDLYQTGTLDALPHLYLLDSAGDVLLHLRGQVWPRSGLESLVYTLGVPIERPPDPLTVSELARLRPQLVHDCRRRAASLGV